MNYGQRNRVLRALAARRLPVLGMTVQQLARVAKADRQEVVGGLVRMERAGLIKYSEEDMRWTITKKGKAMARRAKEEHDVSTTQHERKQLAQRMYGPHWQAMLAVAGDNLLAQGLRAAIDRGIEPIDLSMVPKYKHQERIHEQIVAFNEATSRGPCAACGSAKARRGHEGETATMVTRSDGHTYCGTCSDMLTVMSDTQFRCKVLRAICGVQGDGSSGGPGVRLFHEVAAANVAAKPGKPWAHVDRKEAERAALTYFHPSQFHLNAEKARMGAIPGVSPRVWSKDELPQSNVTAIRPDTPGAGSEPIPNASRLLHERQVAATQEQINSKRRTR